MKKQILYAKFAPRLFAMTLDLAVLSLILTPLMNIFARLAFMYFFGDFFAQQGIDHDPQAMLEASRTPEFAEFITLGSFLKYVIMLMAINGIFMACYFVGFWHYYSATPGKMIMRMKIVDSEDFSKPSISRLIRRFFGYITAFVGIWSIVFSEKGQALHDKIARTVVIKS